MAAIHEKQQHHFVLFPFMAQGHMIPMIDVARLLAKHDGVIVTILITPNNYTRFKRVIAREVDSGFSLRVFHLELPCAEAGLPVGLDNFDMLPSLDYAMKFHKATALLKDQVEQFLRQAKPPPSCLISDFCYPWTTNVAVKLHIPRLLFHGMGILSLICTHMLAASKTFEDIASDTEYFVVPDLPDRIEITKAQIRGMANQFPPEWHKLQEEVQEAEKQAFGTVVNSFEELEPEYVEKYRDLTGKKVWCIGPVSSCNRDDLDKAERGDKASIDEHHCLKWLDSHESSSVLYVCLGSLSYLPTAQLIELGLGLEASNRPFIWVIRNASDELEQWLSDENFEERINDRGLLIRGWAPQLLILSHPSVGGFLTHCGWNSTLEGIAAGAAMITWPLFADQFRNEKFIVNVVKTGVRVGVEVPFSFIDNRNAGVQVTSDNIKNVVKELMDGGEEGRERRERARKLGEMAKSAVDEGGSSDLNMKMLIQDVITQRAANNGDQSADD